ncbi:MAG: ATP-dependent DNA helicase RecQ [Bacteroidetes bacterium ADurb.Bin234]|nr:MAG: ATP-dependent DNA helicase RecQ [Bacteroidetes bacterium ADurb.Bin234]
MTKVSSQELHDQLKRIFGFNHFKGNQEIVIQSILEGKDSFVIMPTGGGKSMCYQLPAMIMEGTAIVISPLIALMKNQVDSLRNFSLEKGIAHVYNSSLTKIEQAEVKQDLFDGKTKLLYVAPESLVKEENISILKKIKISFIAIDEAHCISEWGHDFRPEYRKIKSVVDSIEKKIPIMALTATATPKVRHDIQKNLGMLNAEVYLSSFNRPNIYYEVRNKTKDVDKEIIKFIKNHNGQSGIVYCLSRKQVEDFAELLQVNKIKALPYHAGLDGAVRIENQDKFLMEEADVIVATIAFGMGIDKPNVRYIIHYDMPKSLEGYYQETGRSGRDDGEANCIAFYSYDDLMKLEKLMKNKPFSEQEISRQLLSETISYAESTLCRRRHLLFYFGETYNNDNCGCCDNCLHPKLKMEGKEYIQVLLLTVKELKQQFKEKHVINVIIGNASSDIKKFKHNQLKCFGEGQDKDDKFWSSLIRQMLFEKLLVKDIENYGILKITPVGEKFLKSPYSIKITKTDEEEDDEDQEIGDVIPTQKDGVIDKVLFNLLKDLLKGIAKKENLPPYVIFQEISLEDMCVQYPTNMEEMTQITGVGAGKAQKYGQPFIDLIRRYVEENEIERPQDLVVKSVINKSGLKVYIIQNIDRKISFEDIAKAKNLSKEDLLTEIESIIFSGTKLDINYYIDETIDMYHQEEIMEYLMNSELDSLETAIKDLGEDEYSMEEIRLMRIKFLSDMGN